MVKKPATSSGKKRTEQDIGGSSGTKRDNGTKNNDRSSKEQSKDEGSTAGSTNLVKAPIRK